MKSDQYKPHKCEIYIFEILRIKENYYKKKIIY